MEFHLTLIFFILIIKNCDNLERPKFYRCGFDDEKYDPIIIKDFKPINKTNLLYKRRLDSDGFKDFNIYLDIANIENDIRINNLDKYHDLFINSMKKAVKTLTNLLKVKPLEDNFEISNSVLGQLNINHWNKSNFGDAAIYKGNTLSTLNIDLVIFGKIESLDDSKLASASGMGFDRKGQPFLGLVKINKNVDYSKEKSQEYFQAIVLHEFTHILGFSISAFRNTYKNIFTKIDDFGVMRTYINSSKVLEVARKYFNCSDLEGVELEDYGGEGTAGSHWEARILLGDYMNGFAYTEEMVVSEFTLALLEDTGYYKANYYTGGLMRYGKNKGCEFVRGQCVDKTTHKINPLFYNEFYDTISMEKMMEPSCSAGRQSRTYSAFYKYYDIPEVFQYFGDNSTGGYSPADYCPVPLKHSDEEEKANYAGQCSNKGSGEYGSKIKYSSEFISPLSKNMLAVTAEKLSDISFCFLSSLTKNSLQISYVYSSVVRAVCYEIFCSSKSLTVKIHEDYIVCPREGGKIIADGYDGYFLCPDYNLMCSGTVICNDIFDCVDKKSEIKEDSFIYDYIPKTSQNIEEANELDPNEKDNYELSNDGVCPQFCKQCKENNKCSKCIDGFVLEGDIIDGKIICSNKSELIDGYFIDENNVHFKCIQNCELCSNVTGCDKCLRGYALNDNACIRQEKVIKYCHEYDINETCIKCIKDYAFKEDDRTTCILKTNFEYYYTMDGGISYYPCSEKNSKCTKCYYNIEENSVKCSLCKNDFILINENGWECSNKTLINNQTKYVLVNKTHAEICEHVIPNCVECENIKKCKKCKEDYYFNNYDNECLLKENITQNYPEERKKNETKKPNNPQNGNMYISLSIFNIIKIQILFLLLLY